MDIMKVYDTEPFSLPAFIRQVFQTEEYLLIENTLFDVL